MGFDFDSDDLIEGEQDHQKSYSWKFISVVSVGSMILLYLLMKIFGYAIFNGDFWERWSL